MIELKRVVDEERNDWQWFWVDQHTLLSISEHFDNQEAAIEWALANYDKENMCIRPVQLWKGRERRSGVADRRVQESRRGDIRFEPGKPDRRQSYGRRAQDSLGWSSKSIR